MTFRDPPRTSRLFHITDRSSGLRFLVDTGAEVTTPYIFNAKPDRYSPRGMSQLDYISQFTTDVRYTPGSDIVVVDALSRHDINDLRPSTQLDLAKLANLQNSKRQPLNDKNETDPGS
ncbi:hypothetical protein T265_01866 [Opisthorchis viverrini]|uniref:Peptidase A2 domain-containing protein n=1 Tax=Opisthorchis viverrini TaxID=6198 RepID=A0A075AIN2_OPIVI|nr:hypothetical protein T265_01866 [Opisthorchis viverrini]KER31929.1 hypothetical protein T265_01866 [Opisthorchis viverrini]